MLLSKLQKGDSAIIKNIYAKGDLKHRFLSFGIVKGATIFVDEFSLTKSTIKIIVGNSMTALRLEEAEKIEVDLIK